VVVCVDVTSLRAPPRVLSRAKCVELGLDEPPGEPLQTCREGDHSVWSCRQPGRGRATRTADIVKYLRPLATGAPLGGGAVLTGCCGVEGLWGDGRSLAHAACHAPSRLALRSALGGSASLGAGACQACCGASPSRARAEQSRARHAAGAKARGVRWEVAVPGWWQGGVMLWGGDRCVLTTLRPTILRPTTLRPTIPRLTTLRLTSVTSPCP
jgi:hypothetical protein